MQNRSSSNSKRYIAALVYDLLILALAAFIFLYLNPSTWDSRLQMRYILLQFGIAAVCIFGMRFANRVYRQILRYGGSRLYIRLIIADLCAGIIYYAVQHVIPEHSARINFLHVVCIVAFDLLGAVAARLIYQYVFEFGSRRLWTYPVFRWVVKLFTGLYLEDPESRAAEEGSTRLTAGGETTEETQRELAMNIDRHNLAIVGAGRIGVMLAKELLTNQHSAYVPVCLIDRDTAKSGREIFGIPVIAEDDTIADQLKKRKVEEIVFALPRMHAEQKTELYERYRPTGCRILVYDYPLSQTNEFGKRTIREFSIEELLFRDAKEFMSDEVMHFYADKVVLVTGGGGSIGSELCRQIARMHPRRLILLDVYENGAYDVQQELKMKYGSTLALDVEICTVTDREKLDRIFAAYRPDVVLHAAAHKHVPLMEHNCVEAVKNNVFGTKNVVDCALKYHAGNFLMVSTDKAVNPTNVMGATKRMCEMLVMARAGEQAEAGKITTKFCATRFGNVLGSNGSVVPLFKKQIAAGGPVTITDRRIIRYFMTIPEATQLVLTCGAMSSNGELFALDMGKPMPILELAENMVRLSGFEPYKDIAIVETGLRPGEKLYEELLINFEEMEKTENDMIYVERSVPLSESEISGKLGLLADACATQDDETVKAALHEAVPTFKTPEEVNRTALESREFKMSREA